MKKYKIIPHTADAKIFVAGSNLSALFEAALLGMNEILKKGFCRSQKRFCRSQKGFGKKTHQNLITKEIEISSFDQTSLVVDFLSEVLTISHINEAIFCQIKFKKFENDKIIAEIQGSKVDKFDKDIKAVSYHQAEIIKNKKGNYQTNIVFDI